MAVEKCGKNVTAPVYSRLERNIGPQLELSDSTLPSSFSIQHNPAEKNLELRFSPQVLRDNPDALSPHRTGTTVNPNSFASLIQRAQFQRNSHISECSAVGQSILDLAPTLGLKVLFRERVGENPLFDFKKSYTYTDANNRSQSISFVTEVGSDSVETKRFGSKTIGFKPVHFNIHLGQLLSNASLMTAFKQFSGEVQKALPKKYFKDDHLEKRFKTVPSQRNLLVLIRDLPKGIVDYKEDLGSQNSAVTSAIGEIDNKKTYFKVEGSVVQLTVDINKLKSDKDYREQFIIYADMIMHNTLPNNIPNWKTLFPNLHSVLKAVYGYAVLTHRMEEDKKEEAAQASLQPAAAAKRAPSAPPPAARPARQTEEPVRAVPPPPPPPPPALPPPSTSDPAPKRNAPPAVAPAGRDAAILENDNEARQAELEGRAAQARKGEGTAPQIRVSLPTDVTGDMTDVRGLQKKLTVDERREAARARATRGDTRPGNDTNALLAPNPTIEHAFDGATGVPAADNFPASAPRQLDPGSTQVATIDNTALNASNRDARIETGAKSDDVRITGTQPSLKDSVIPKLQATRNQISLALGKLNGNKKIGFSIKKGFHLTITVAANGKVTEIENFDKIIIYESKIDSRTSQEIALTLESAILEKKAKEKIKKIIEQSTWPKNDKPYKVDIL